MIGHTAGPERDFVLQMKPAHVRSDRQVVLSDPPTTPTAVRVLEMRNNIGYTVGFVVHDPLDRAPRVRSDLDAGNPVPARRGGRSGILIMDLCIRET